MFSMRAVLLFLFVLFIVHCGVNLALVYQLLIIPCLTRCYVFNFCRFICVMNNGSYTLL